MRMANAFILAVRVRPNARRTAVGGRADTPNGPALVVDVTAAAVDGRATEATLRAITEALELPRGSVSLRTGATSRLKLLTISDPPPDLAERIARLRDGLGL